MTLCFASVGFMSGLILAPISSRVSKIRGFHRVPHNERVRLHRRPFLRCLNAAATLSLGLPVERGCSGISFTVDVLMAVPLEKMPPSHPGRAGVAIHHPLLIRSVPKKASH